MYPTLETTDWLQILFFLTHSISKYWRSRFKTWGWSTSIIDRIWKGTFWQSDIHFKKWISVHFCSFSDCTSLLLCQYSAYIMDERFPGVPMLKWDHMMQSPPMFCHIIPGCASSGSAVGKARTSKILLGSHSSQEITLLQYSGQSTGRAQRKQMDFAISLQF